ncbi:hypothetical protein, partial [Actinomadura sp. HBU206391]|uniref:hypothetical protein n=1 Tax=Actinomadura sp. HBU206391 TaxID=2731692 RepID=UPI00165051C9
MVRVTRYAGPGEAWTGHGRRRSVTGSAAAWQGAGPAGALAARSRWGCAMALLDTIKGSFGSDGFSLDGAAGELTDAFRGVAPPGVDVDADAIAAFAGRIAGADPSGALTAVTGLAGGYGDLLDSVARPGGLAAALGQAVTALGSLGGGIGDAGETFAAALRAPEGDRTVDRLVAIAQDLSGVRAAPLAEVLRLVAADALPALPPSVTGALPALLGRAEGVRALAEHLATLSAAGSVASRTAMLASALDELSDPAALQAATAAVMAVDGTALAAIVSSGDPEDEIVAAVTAGLAPVGGYADEAGRLLVGALATLQFLDPPALEQSLTTAAQTALTADLAPVRALAETLADRLAPVLALRPAGPAAPSVQAFADDLAEQLTRLIAAVDDLDTAGLAAPVHDATEQVVAPVRAVRDTVHDTVTAVRGALENARTAVEAVGVEAVADAVHTVLDPVIEAVEDLRALLEPIAEAIGRAAAEASEAVAEVRTTVESTLGEVGEAFDALSDAVTELDLAGELEELRATMDEVAAAIEGVALGRAVDTAVGLVDDAAGVIEKIPLDLLPDAARADLHNAVAPIKTVDFGTEVREPLTRAVAAVLGDLEGPFLDEVAALSKELLDFLATIDPTSAFRQVESEAFEPFLARLRTLDPDELLAPVREALSGLGSLKDLLAPADEAFDQVLDAIRSLDPGPLLNPLADQVDEVREQIAAALHLTELREQVDAACDRLLESCDLVRLADVLDGFVLAFDRIWPPPGSGQAGMAGTQILGRLLGTAAGALDGPAFAAASQWITGGGEPAAHLAA